MPEKKKPDPIIPVRIPADLQKRIKAAAEAMGLPDAEVMRLAMSIGLEHLKRIDHDLAKLIVDSGERIERSVESPSHASDKGTPQKLRKIA